MNSILDIMEVQYVQKRRIKILIIENVKKYNNKAEKLINYDVVIYKYNNLNLFNANKEFYRYLDQFKYKLTLNLEYICIKSQYEVLLNEEKIDSKKYLLSFSILQQNFALIYQNDKIQSNDLKYSLASLNNDSLPIHDFDNIILFGLFCTSQSKLSVYGQFFNNKTSNNYITTQLNVKIYDKIKMQEILQQSSVYYKEQIIQYLENLQLETNIQLGQLNLNDPIVYTYQVPYIREAQVNILCQDKFRQFIQISRAGSSNNFIKYDLSFCFDESYVQLHQISAFQNTSVQLSFKLQVNIVELNLEYQLQKDIKLNFILNPTIFGLSFSSLGQISNDQFQIIPKLTLKDNVFQSMEQYFPNIIDQLFRSFDPIGIYTQADQYSRLIFDSIISVLQWAGPLISLSELKLPVYSCSNFDLVMSKIEKLGLLNSRKIIIMLLLLKSFNELQEFSYDKINSQFLSFGGFGSIFKQRLSLNFQTMVKMFIRYQTQMVCLKILNDNKQQVIIVCSLYEFNILVNNTQKLIYII